MSFYKKPTKNITFVHKMRYTIVNGSLNKSICINIYIYIFTYTNLLSRRNTITRGGQMRRAKTLRLIMRNNIYIYIHIPQYKSKLAKGNRKERN